MFDQKILKDFKSKGFVNLGVLISNNQIKELSDGFDRVIQSIRNTNYDELDGDPNIDDAPFLDKIFSDIIQWPVIRNICKIFLPSNRGVELQHMKINSKSKSNQSGGIKEVKLHQDYPFFPHTNFDLLAITISLDELTEHSGCLEYFTSKNLFKHSKNNKFVGYMDDTYLKNKKGKKILGPPGTVTVHSCLSPHRSMPNLSNLKRRLLVIQVRTMDNKQISGPIWRCTGLPIINPKDNFKGKIRFIDGTIVENRGSDGRLFDIYGTLGKDK